VPSPTTDASRTLTGVGLAATAWAAFSAQDAIIKYLVVTIPVPEMLFVRSLLITLAASLVLRRSEFVVMLQRRSLAAIGVRAGFILVAWLTYYAAARWLSLPALVTIYFAAPLFVVALAGIMLGETPGPARWGATIIGFVGVVVAADLSAAPSALPALMVLFAAFCWAVVSILTRSLTQAITTKALMVGTNVVFVFACALVGPFLFVVPSPFECGLLLLLGICGGVGQFFLFQGMRLAQASAIAPFEYSSFAWATLWGWLVFGDLPTPHVLTGGAIILGAGLFLLAAESRRRATLNAQARAVNFTAAP
jgi:S-adenosylmethionine uptake transporter